MGISSDFAQARFVGGKLSPIHRSPLRLGPMPGVQWERGELPTLHGMGGVLQVGGLALIRVPARRQLRGYSRPPTRENGSVLSAGVDRLFQQWVVSMPHPYNDVLQWFPNSHDVLQAISHRTHDRLLCQDT